MQPLPPLGGGRTRLGASLSFQPNQELTSPDDSAALMEIKQMLSTFTTALAMMATKVEQLSQGHAPKVAPVSAQPGTRAGEDSTDISSTPIDLDMEQQVQTMVEHWLRTAHTPGRPMTDIGMGGGTKDHACGIQGRLT